ncbi:MAG: hypothetical protein M3P93_15565 [Actinomycetota bacterium]|nr:hypothetical protein [Actinomycetota bacterium]
MDLRSAPALAPAETGAHVPGPRSGSRRGQRPVPQRDAAYGHLGLEELRAYRTALQDEEGKVSYWRRILQARLDVLRAGGAGPAALDADLLRPVLADTRVTRGRAALVQVLPADDIPPLPSLAELWERRVAASDVAGNAALEADLGVAEEQLSAYRVALHRRMAEATAELIARYREQPSLCLVALPLPRPRAVVTG